MPLQVYLESLGCKLNQCERDALARRFVEEGHVVVDRAEDADVCVVNTCAVTHVAAQKSRRRFRQLQRINLAARLVATGCYAGMEKNGLHADLVVLNDRKEDLVSLVTERLEEWGLGRVVAGSGRISPGRARSPAPTWGGMQRTRAMVKIQDGCDNACTFCVIHLLRGRQRSRPRDEILAQVAAWVQQGVHEVVLTGVHVGAYGRDSGDDLIGLVGAILAETPPDRLRLSSIEPWDLTPEFFSLWQDPHLCRHLHLPLQSGCNATLRRMNRHYTTAQYAGWVSQARAAIPGLALTTDLIAGFPGETEQEFVASAEFVARMAFARAHVFSYSERPGTPAATMPGAVDPQVRRQRAWQLREIARRSGEAFRRQFVGQTLPVLWETRCADGRWPGLTDHYIRVFTESEQDLANTLCDTRLTGLDAGGMRGELR